MVFVILSFAEGLDKIGVYVVKVVYYCFFDKGVGYVKFRRYNG